MKVSIIIPFYNASATIERCIKSAIAQTYKNIEIICVDNNSEDDSVNILQKYLNEYSNILFYTESRKGANFARNLGTEKASGAWINYLDADDFLDNSKIDNQVKTLNAIKEHSFIVSSYYYVTTTGEKRKHYIKFSDTWKNLFSGNLGITSSNLFKKTNILKVGMWNEAYKSSQEAELMFKIIKIYGPPFLMKNEFQTVVYEQKSNISNVNKSNNLKTFLKLRILILEYLMESENEYFQKEKQWFLNELLTISLNYFYYDKTFSKRTYNKFLDMRLRINRNLTFNRIMLILAIKCFGFSFGAFIYKKMNSK